jgi:RHS repeat-associated protein
MILGREWDGAGRVTRIHATAPTSASLVGTLVDLRYEYAASILFRFTDTDGTSPVYAYDPLNQLMSETRQTADGKAAGQRIWTYDANKNRDSQTNDDSSTIYTFDDADQLMTACQLVLVGDIERCFNPSNITYGYDKDGNLMDRSDGLHIDYDGADHATAMVPPAISGGAAAELIMNYAGLAQTQRTFLKRRGAPQTIFTYDQTGIGPSSQQPGSAGSSPDFFTRTPGSRLVSLRNGNKTFFYIRDRLDSVVALTGFNPATGTTFIANRYRYSPWGEILYEREAVPQRFKFAGAEYDIPTGLYKMGARYYDPAVGRFTQMNSLAGGYTYAFNDPINFNDPTGYDIPCTDWKCILFWVLLSAGGSAIYDIMKSATQGAVAMTTGPTPGYVPPGLPGPVGPPAAGEDHPVSPSDAGAGEGKSGAQQDASAEPGGMCKEDVTVGSQCVAGGAGVYDATTQQCIQANTANLGSFYAEQWCTGGTP